MRRGARVIALGLLAATGTLVNVSVEDVAGADPQGPTAPPRALLVAEDRRANTREEAAPILAALHDGSPALVRRAVLALGRLEDPQFVTDIKSVLAHASAAVRAEAVHALAHSTGGDPGLLLPVLRERLAHERDTEVRRVILETIGRLPYQTPAERTSVEPLLARPLAGDTAPPGERLGAAEGLENLIRGARGTIFVPDRTTLDALRRVVRPSGRPTHSAGSARLRRLALAALNAAGAIDQLHRHALADADEQVRRLAIAGVGRDGVAADLRAAVVDQGLADASAMVRYEALRVHGRHLASESCAAELGALSDPNIHVATLAIDLLGGACPARPEATQALVRLVRGIEDRGRVPESRIARAAHALVSLAGRDASRARSALGAFVTHTAWRIRIAAATAAVILMDGATLERLASDPHDNVREAAIDGVAKVRGHDADGLFLAALERPAYQVVMAAARALARAPQPERAVPVLLKTLAALTAQARDTSRDPRAALLTRLEEMGATAGADALRPYLADRDPHIAALAARVLTTWTGEKHEAATTRVTPFQVPPQEELDHLPAGMRVLMAGGRSFDVAFDTWDSTLTVWRIARLARQGYYDGLTFHRVVPNFVIQGGSPGANEYVGDGPFMRDECGPRSNLRGSIGVSTRGRDTGDAQVYVNLVDNERLDHHYPVFGEVVRGMAVVDAMTDEDVIAKIELLPSIRMSGAHRGEGD
ncbi:MAG: HEAT repeat domain-containing protein [Acidobacteriota bacterium]